MNIKEVAQLTGLTHQAIYKRLKARGVKLETLKDKATGEFTPEGTQIIKELFSIDATEKNDKKDDSTQVEKLRNQVAELTTEVEKLRNQVATVESERDYLRGALEREQQLQAMTLTKLPPALPPSDEEKQRRRTWWDRIRGRA